MGNTMLLSINIFQSWLNDINGEYTPWVTLFTCHMRCFHSWINGRKYYKYSHFIVWMHCYHLAIPSCYPTIFTWFVHCDDYRGIQFVLVKYVPSMLHWHNGFEGWYLTTKSCEDMIRCQWVHTLQGSCLWSGLIAR